MPGQSIRRSTATGACRIRNANGAHGMGGTYAEAAPRSMAEHIFDVRVWQEPTAGGHFGAWERPEEYVEGVRAAIALA